MTDADYTNDDYNDVQSRIIEGSGYGEFSFDQTLSPYLDTYSNYKNVNNSLQKIQMLLTYIMGVGNMVIELHPDDNVKKNLVDYLGDKNFIIEEAKEKTDDIVEKLNTISQSDYNIPDLINGNSNNLDEETIKSVEELFKYLNSEAIAIVLSIEVFKDELLLDFKEAIEECVIQSNMTQSIMDDCNELFEEYTKAMEDNDEVAINRVTEQINKKLHNGFSELEDVVNGGGGINFNIGKDPLDVLDLSQDINNPNLLEVKDNILMTDVDFMNMLEKRGPEYAEEYIYTLPTAERPRFFKLMDL